MLILIVVAAAIALAAFVASYEKQVLAEESESQQRSLESLRILSVDPVLEKVNPSLIGNFTFVLASEYINPSQVDSISLNGQPLRTFWALNIADIGGKSTEYNTSSPLILSAREEVTITVNLTAPGGSFTFFSLFDDSFVLNTSSYIELSVFTLLQNTFTQVFIPPTAVGFVTDLTSYSGCNPAQIPLLDGTQSFQPGTNASIVQWSWAVVDETGGSDMNTGHYLECSNSTLAWSSTPVACIGAEVELSSLESGGFSGSIVATLTVTDSNQLTGDVSVSFTYTAP